MVLGRTFIISEAGTGCTFYLYLYLCHCQTQYFRSELPTDSSDEPDFLMLTNPEKSLSALINLIHDCQVFMAFSPLYIVDADGFDARQVLPLTPPGDSHLHRAEHMVPRCAKGFSDLLPAHPLRPLGQIPGVVTRNLTLAHRPRHMLHFHSTTSQSTRRGA